jgi:hypothetical protein
MGEIFAELKQLQKEYGKVPEKDTTPAEMRLRYQTLSAALENILESSDEQPTRLRATHTYRVSSDFPAKQYHGLESYANVDDTTLRKAPITTLEGIGNLLNFNAEYLERIHKREEIKRRSAQEWRKLEREYVYRSDFTITDLYSDFKDLIEDGVATWEDYREERKKWRGCKHRFCLNMFPIDKDNFKGFKKRPINSEYCCCDCKQKEMDARKRYKDSAEFLDNPTYLPKWFYSEVTEDWREKKRQAIEVSVEAVKLESLINERRPMMKPKKLKTQEIQEAGPVITYNLNDLTDEELIEKNLMKYAKNRGKNSFIK